MSRPYRICSFCIMDTTDPRIVFDEKGECNHCRRYRERLARERPNLTREVLEAQLSRVKERNAAADYDCVLGLSGGIDSSYTAHIAHRYGLRVLVFHLDNGWNSEASVGNIERLIRTYGFALHTHVLDWDEFRDLQRSLFLASVVDVELATDHAINALNYRLAAENGIKTILSGTNWRTECLMPYSWNHTKTDLLNLIAIHSRFGSRRLKNYPMLDPYHLHLYRDSMGIEVVEPLNYIDYDPAAARDLLSREILWRDYGPKHGESIFTRFYQEYYLPRKFGFEKRRAHLSNLVAAGIISRAEALSAMEERPGENELEEMREYVLKKLGFSDEEFAAIMADPPRSHFDYPSGASPRN